MISGNGMFLTGSPDAPNCWCFVPVDQKRDRWMLHLKGPLAGAVLMPPALGFPNAAGGASSSDGPAVLYGDLWPYFQLMR